MKLFLTSSAAKTLDKLTLLLPKPPKEMKVAFIPTAGDLYKEKPWMEADRTKLIKMGFQVFDLDITNKTELEIRKALNNSDIIFVAGGNTSYLLEKAQQSGFLKVAKELVSNGKIYIGSSAGSLLAGPNIEVDKIYDDGEYGKELSSYDALGFVDFVILPHADYPEYQPQLQRIYNEYGSKYKFKELKDNQAICVIDSNIQLIEV